MAGKNTAAFGIYRDRAGVETAVDMLREQGFRNTDISVLFPHNEGTKDFATRKTPKLPKARQQEPAPARSWVAHWAGSPALARWRFRAWDRSSRPVRSWRRWPAWASAEPIGGLTGALVGMGIPEYEAKRYEGRIKEGGILLSVHCDDSDWTKKAKEILEASGAQDVTSTGEAKADFQKTDKPMPRAS